MTSRRTSDANKRKFAFMHDKSQDKSCKKRKRVDYASQKPRQVMQTKENLYLCMTSRRTNHAGKEKE